LAYRPGHCADGKNWAKSKQIALLEGIVATIYPNSILWQIKFHTKTIEKHCTFARVSTHEQKEDLKRQVNMLETYSCAHGWNFEVIQDMGSGLNYHKRGLKKLIQQICSGSIERLLLTHKDRLLRFGSEIIFSLCEHFGVEVVIINACENCTFEDELATDVLEIITVFSARLYGSRSHKNREIMKTLKETANEICCQDSP
jgi:predicted site-specific integrase-resolvase